MSKLEVSLPKEPSVRNQLKSLHCFCGIGGDSDGFALEGFDVTGIDIVDAPKMLGYKHRFIQADMLTLKGEDFRGFDVIWGSPPCRHFSIIAKTLGHRWKEKPNVEKGLELVRAYLTFVQHARPRFWILENVHLLKNSMPISRPQFITHLGKGMQRAFWGHFPACLIPRDMSKALSSEKNRLNWNGNNRLKSWERAKIPLACSRAFARACREALEPKVEVVGV